jgi:predicted ArsR family transcriptional regulator
MDYNILLRVLEDENISSSAKVLWIRLYLTYGTHTGITTLYVNLAKELKINTWTVSSNMRMLIKRGAIKVNRNYDENGRAASTFTLADPSKWKKTK